MKLNQECVRDILLELEEKLTFNNALYLQQVQELEAYKKYGNDETLYAILKLIEVNYLIGSKKISNGGVYYLSLSAITWNGHEFLDSIRSNEVWQETKNRVKDFSSVSIGILSEVAKEYIMRKLFGTN